MADYFVPKDMAVAMVAAITGEEDEGVIIGQGADEFAFSANITKKGDRG